MTANPLRLPALTAIVLATVGAFTDATLAQRAAKAPASAVAAAQDEDFQAFVKKATTKPEFLSPLVDHLPKRAGVPTPKDILGYHVGAEKKLTYWADQQKWFRTLEKAMPGRVKTTVIGKTEEGREIMVVYLTSDANLKNLDQNRANMRKLADPRGLSAADAQTLIAATKPHYHLSAGLHSGETNTSEMLMELAYRLATETSPLINQIRSNVYVSITPVADADGRDRNVDWFYRGLDMQASAPPPPAGDSAAAGGRGGAGNPFGGNAGG